METIVRLEQVTKKYGRLVALEQVTLSIGPGVTGLLGPNGAGKTTLIKVLLGLVRISAGEEEVLGFRLKGNARKIHHPVGYMPEDDCYIPGLSGVESVELNWFSSWPGWYRGSPSLARDIGLLVRL